MFCATCNLHYPDHLNYCRRCGKALVQTVVEAVKESLSCTRCGARVGRGENFCQQCGYRLGVKGEEAVVGACYHCGTSWRSDWFFCKVCGLDREGALLPPISAPAVPARLRSSDVKLVERIPRVEVEKVYCPDCTAEAKPYSRYCETCGVSLEAGSSGKLWLALETNSLESAPEESLAAVPLTPVQAPEDSAKSPAVVEEVDIIELPQVSAVRRDKNGAEEIKEERQAKTAARKGFQQQRSAFSPKSLLLLKQKIRSSRAASGVLLGLIVLVVLGVIFLLARRASSVAPAATEEVKNEVRAAASPVSARTPAGGSGAEIAPIEGMVYVPRGEFEMGRVSGDQYASPPLPVVVGPFFIDRTEVTNEEYLQFVKATGHRAPSSWKDGKYKTGNARYPVVNVTWLDAMAYAKWANKRLPTEAEWEFAARGYEQQLYPWGNEWKPGYANAERGAKGRLAEVGSYSQGASPFGALDMCGNVWELTSGNLFDYSDITKEILPGRVIRGGAFDVPRARATTTYRGVVPPDKGFDKTGFRCVRDVLQ